MTGSREADAMLVAVDSSVWIAYFRRADPDLERMLDGLIDADLVAILPPIRLELILGCRKSQRASLLSRIDAVHPLLIRESSWKLAEDFSIQLRDEGITPGAVDILIAAAVSEQQACLWTLDKDFDPLFEAEFVHPFRPA